MPHPSAVAIPKFSIYRLKKGADCIVLGGPSVDIPRSPRINQYVAVFIITIFYTQAPFRLSTIIRIIIFMALTKILFLLGLVLLANTYTEENHVLILTADDLPAVTEEFPFILIEFYAPWCGHCKQLTPIYDEVAKELHEAGSPVRIAKIDADEHSSVKGDFGVQGFPTLLFFSNGQQIKYGGQRTKDVMVGWLSKKTRPAVTEIQSAEIDELTTNGKVNLLLHTNEADGQEKLFEELAVADDYNNYYSIKGSDQPAGTVQIFRSFGDVQSTTVSEDLKLWIGKYERPTVYPFDDRTISTIFGEKGAGLILFESAEAGEVLNEAFAEAAKEIREVRGNSLLFTAIPSDAEHYKGLANYIKVIAEKSPLVVIDGGKRVKYILEASPADLSSEQIIAFAESFITGTGHEYKIDEEVVYSDNTKVEEEL